MTENRVGLSISLTDRCATYISDGQFPHTRAIDPPATEGCLPTERTAGQQKMPHGIDPLYSNVHYIRPGERMGKLEQALVACCGAICT